MNLRSSLAALCLLFAAVGCGQKGPLYLPGDPSEGRIVLPEVLGGESQENAGDDGRPAGEAGEEADEAEPAAEGDEQGQGNDEQ